MREITSLDALVEGLTDEGTETAEKKTGTTLTLWVPVELKERYNRAQQRTKRKLSKGLVEIVDAVVTKVERAG